MSLVKEVPALVVYFIPEGSSTVYTSRHFDYPKESNTMDYMIRQTIKEIADDSCALDGYVVNKITGVRGNLIVIYKLFSWGILDNKRKESCV